MVIVYRTDAMGEREDKYPSAVSWRIDATGVLRVEGAGAARIAVYPDGGWLRAVKGDDEP